MEVTDANGCTAQVTQDITQPDQVVLSVAGFTNETCDYSDDATIDVSAVGGTGAYSFEILTPTAAGPNGTGSFTGLTGDYLPGATTYTMEVTDANGCTAQVTQDITQPDQVVLSVAGFTNETCDYSDDATIDVSAVGGTGAYSFEILSPTAAGPNVTGSFTGLTGDYLPGTTTYTMEVTDANGCTAQVTQDIR